MGWAGFVSEIGVLQLSDGLCGVYDENSIHTVESWLFIAGERGQQFIAVVLSWAGIWLSFYIEYRHSLANSLQLSEIV